MAESTDIVLVLSREEAEALSTVLHRGIDLIAYKWSPAPTHDDPEGEQRWAQWESQRDACTGLLSELDPQIGKDSD